MSSSVGMKARKKQSPLSTRPAASASGRGFETSLLALENACIRILENRSAGTQDIDLLYWQQRLKNIATPISLALAESKGPRHFHYHYRHRGDDASVLQPVLEDPLDTLAQVCEDALRRCQSDLVGIYDTHLVRVRRVLESALQTFLVRYRSR